MSVFRVRNYWQREQQIQNKKKPKIISHTQKFLMRDILVHIGIGNFVWSMLILKPNSYIAHTKINCTLFLCHSFCLHCIHYNTIFMWNENAREETFEYFKQKLNEIKQTKIFEICPFAKIWCDFAATVRVYLSFHVQQHTINTIHLSRWWWWWKFKQIPYVKRLKHALSFIL